jgi:hypothetical protein
VVRLTQRGKRAAWTAAFVLTFLAGMAVQTDRPPACQYEDEVVLHTGECWPLDDSTFTENGWEPR